MISDDKLIGWLCMMRLQWDEDETFHVPASVRTMLGERGWITEDDGVDWEGAKTAHLTDAGNAIIDIHAPDWGINTIPEPSESS